MKIKNFLKVPVMLLQVPDLTAAIRLFHCLNFRDGNEVETVLVFSFKFSIDLLPSEVIARSCHLCRLRKTSDKIA